MRRKIIIVIVVVVLVIVATITFFVIKDLQQEKSLRKEIDEIQKEMVDFEQIDVDKISKKLKATVTTGDYAKIEKAIKNYMADNLNTMLTISEALNDEVIPNALTAENYQNDGPDFVKTRKILKNTQDKLSASKETMIILSKDDTVMSYLKNVDDSYYIDLYKEKMRKDYQEIPNADFNKEYKHSAFVKTPPPSKKIRFTVPKILDININIKYARSIMSED